MLRMFNVNSIHNTLLVRRISHHSITKPFNARSNIQLLTHFSQREISVCPTLSQTKHHLLIQAIRLNRHIIVQRQPSISYKLIIRPRLQQHIKQIGKPLSVQSAWSGSQSQLLCLWISIHHLLISPRHSMMRLIDNYKCGIIVEFFIMPRQPLYRENFDK